MAGATGLGAVIVGVQPLFAAIKWAGIVYLAFLAVQALRSAAAGRYLPSTTRKLIHQLGPGLAARVRIQHHQPQDACLLPRGAAPVPRPAPITPRTRRAWAQPRRASLLYLLLVVTGLARVRRVFSRRPVRRALDAMTGVALLGFGAKLAVDDK